MEAIAAAEAAAQTARALLAEKLRAKQAAATESATRDSTNDAPAAEAEFEDAMEFDDEVTAKVDALLDTLGAGTAVSGDRDGNGTGRSEFKRQLACVVSKGGVVKKKLKKDTQLG